MRTGLLGAVAQLTVGAVAPGGHCVARWPDADGPGMVVFIRHALPGEVVRAVVTEQHRGYLRADAIEVLTPSPDRVPAPCPFAGPGRCGGCDYQHVAPQAQRALKAAVAREQLTRLAGLTADEVDALAVQVRPLPGGPLGWRSRVRYVVDAEGRLGFYAHRSHDVVAVDRCLIAHPAIQELPLTSRRWPDTKAVEAVASSAGDVAVLEPASAVGRISERAVGRDWRIPADAFWQVHPAAADTLAEAVVELLQPRTGEKALDLYGGVGLFAAALAPGVGATGRVTVVERGRAAEAARRCLADLVQVRVVRADVAAALASRPPRWRDIDLVVLDPPRAGAGRAVVNAIVKRRPRAVAYVACDPAAFARDVATFRAAGWRLARLLAYEIFPMTQHFEQVGLLLPGTAEA